MTNQRIPLIIEGEARRAPQSSNNVEMLTRLALGLGLEGVDELLVKLKQWEAEIADGTDIAVGSADETPRDKLRYFLIGAMFESQRRTRKRLSRATAVAGRVYGVMRENWWVQAGESLLADRFDSINRLILEGRLQEQNARRLSRRMTGGTIDEILQYLTDNEHVDRLVNSQVDQLQENPHVHNLSKDIVENFVENPETIRKLVSDQSIGLTSELAEEVRERAVTLDMLGESVIRRLLRRPPRSALSEPPETVQARARHLHSDDDEEVL